MRSITVALAVVGVFLCAAHARAGIVDFQGSFFGAELTYNSDNVDVFSWDGDIAGGEALEFKNNTLPDDLLTDVPSPNDPTQVWSVESQVTLGGPLGVGDGEGRPTGSLLFRFWRPNATNITAQFPVYLNLVGLDAQSPTLYEVIGSVYVSFMPQQTDNPWDGIELAEGDGSQNNTFFQYSADGLGIGMQIAPTSAEGVEPNDEISEFYVGFAVQAVPEPACLVLLASGVIVLRPRSRRR
ncbi:MAG TPA: hypothetical protein VM243_16235 [Phycisphaerae bacterium]|nr:hypothetical protein [Phycisphaerae bacterium]